VEKQSRVSSSSRGFWRAAGDEASKGKKLALEFDHALRRAGGEKLGAHELEFVAARVERSRLSRAERVRSLGEERA
jgi:hypothetical protein